MLHSAFNLQIAFVPGGEHLAGFSEVTGLDAEFVAQEAPNAVEWPGFTRKIPGMYKSGDITLRRGAIDSRLLRDWVNALTGCTPDRARRDLVIRLFDESGSEVVASWRLRGARPLRWTGPKLTSNDDCDAAIEELVLSAESIEVV